MNTKQRDLQVMEHLYTRLGNKEEDTEELLDSICTLLGVGPVNPTAEYCKDLGNKALAEDKLEAAITCYTGAIDLSPDGPLTHIYLANRAAANTKLGEWSKVEEDCLAALELRPDYVKASNRLAAAYHQQGKTAEAQRVYEGVLLRDPSNAVALANRAKEQPLKLNPMFDKIAQDLEKNGGGPEWEQLTKMMAQAGVQLNMKL